MKKQRAIDRNMKDAMRISLRESTLDADNENERNITEVYDNKDINASNI
jgi:hypothetical protein